MNPQTANWLLREIPLASLRFGHEHPGGEVNIRKPSRADGESLAPSIRQEGLLQPLCVWDGGGGGPRTWYVLAGGRRLMALHVLRDQGAIPANFVVPCTCIDGGDPADALAKSLATEDTHVPPHPVDRFEAFQHLSDRGLTGKAIAARFFVPEKTVRQALALGALAPEVREAWRSGAIDQAAAQCFTLAENPAQQAKVLAKLAKKGDALDAAMVRKQFTGSEIESMRLLGFVTRAAYVDAGGALSEDLFTDALVIHDFAKLKRLAEERLERECAALKADGWSFAEVQLRPDYMQRREPSPKPQFTAAEKARLAAIAARGKEIDATPDHDLPEVEAALCEENDRLQDERLSIEAAAIRRAWTPAQKAKLGCAVRIAHDGTGIDITDGLHPAPPRDNGAAAPHTGAGNGAAKPAKPAEPAFDHETNRALAAWRAQAAGEILMRDEPLALAVLLAHLQTGHGPLGISAGYDVEHVFIPRCDDFAKVLKELRKQKPATLVSLVVKAIGEEVIDDGLDVEGDFLDLLDPKEYAKALARRFDAKPYFAGCSKPHLLAIITESWGAEHANAALSKTDLAALCVRNIAPRGWLPLALRTTLYKPVLPSAPLVGEVAAKQPKGGTVPTPKKRGRPAKVKPAGAPAR